MIKKFSAILAIIAVLSILAGCGVANKPEAVAKAFMNAMIDGNFDKAAKYATEESGQALKALGAFGGADAMDEAAGQLGDLDITVKGSKVTGDTAVVTMEAMGTSSDLALVKEDGKWKVDFDKEGGMGGMMDKAM